MKVLATAVVAAALFAVPAGAEAKKRVVVSGGYCAAPCAPAPCAPACAPACPTPCFNPLSIVGGVISGVGSAIGSIGCGISGAFGTCSPCY